MRTLIYIRQSITRDEPGESLSLAFQERTLRQLVKGVDGIVIEPPIVDPDERGNDPNRPGIAELLTRVAVEKPDAVAVYAVSRFARDNWLQEGLWRRMKAIHPELRFLSATEPHAEDDMVRGILGVISQAERKRMGAFLSSAFRERARRGLPHGRTPFGYVKGSDGRLLIDEDAAPIVQQLVAELEAGHSLWRVAVDFNAINAGNRNWEPNMVRYIARSPAIAGGVKCGDVITWNAHEPIIERQRWERLTALLDTRTQIKRKPAESWLEGMIVCGCGAPMHLITNRHVVTMYRQFRCSANATFQPFQRPKKYPPCTTRPRSITADKAERFTLAALTVSIEGICSPDQVFNALQVNYARLVASSGSHHRTTLRQLQKAETERDRLLTLYRRGTLDVERWEYEDNESAATIARLTAELAAYGNAPDRQEIEAQHARLLAASTMIGAALEHDPSQARRIMYALGVTAQRTPSGVALIWPSEFVLFLNAIV